MSASAEPTPLIERFTRAVRDRDADALRAMRPRRAELLTIVNEPLFAFDSPALVAVAEHGDVGVIDALLDLGGDPNRRSAWWAGGFHPLHLALGGVAERLLAAGAIPDACAAARLDRTDLLASMLAADRSLALERGGDGQTPLHFARSRAVVDLLLDAGADPDAVDVDHRSTPAQWMLGGADDSNTSRLTIARYLVERGARVDIFLSAALGLTDRVRAMLQANAALLDQRTGQGDYGERPPSSYHIYLWTIGPNLTPLQTAAQFRQGQTVEFMRQFASAEQRLMLACHEGNSRDARAIVASEPGIVERLGPDDRRALTDAAWRANAPAVDLMLELGFDPSVVSTTGATGGTALHCAAWEGSVECVTAILRFPAGRALVHVLDASFHGTPLGWCCHGSLNCGRSGANHAEVARLLIAGGARATDGMRAASEPVRNVIDALT